MESKNEKLKKKEVLNEKIDYNSNFKPHGFEYGF